MKRTNYFTRLVSAAACLLLLAASCSSDDPIGIASGATDGEIRFEISFAPRDGAVQTYGTSTRVVTDTQFNSKWEEGDAIGIFAAKHGTSLAATGNPLHNVKLTYTNSTWTADETLYWPAGKGSYVFYAYYPYDATLTDPTQYTFSAAVDQSAKDKDGRSRYNLSDLLLAKDDNKGKGFSRGQTVSLSFAHAMALVEVKVSKTILPGDGNSALAVSLDGCSTTQTLNLAEGIPSGWSAPESIRMYPCPEDDGTGTYSYRALVAAGTTVPASTVLFHFRYGTNGVLTSPQLTKDLNLTPGKAETFSITLPSVVTVSTTNRIADLIPAAEQDKLTYLKVSGEMTAEDFEFIRDHLPALTSLDLRRATVKEKTIPDRAFYEKSGLLEFIYPTGLTAIGNEAFYGCSGLTGSLAFAQSVTSIGTRAFYGCSGFNGSLTIHGGIQSIGDEAFSGCSQITSITTHIRKPYDIFRPGMFSDMSSETVVYVPDDLVGSYKGHPGWNQFKNIQPITQTP